jgi:glycosyltransferase involved in cell wall biosynthesis
MIHVFLNGSAASAGGGLTYLRNVVPELSARTDARATVLVGKRLRSELDGLTNVEFVEMEEGGGTIPRFVREQTRLPALIRRCGADALWSTGNVALRRSPVPQILLSRNSLYTSEAFYRDLRDRGAWRLWLETRVKGELAKQSVSWADRTVVPSEAFAAELRRWTGSKIAVVHHGFDRKLFFSDTTQLVPPALEGIRSIDGPKLLFVSHYNYYRNFETLLRALAAMQRTWAGIPPRLLLTCRFGPGENPDDYNSESAAALMHSLGVRDLVLQLGEVPYRELHYLYSTCDLYVTPAYAETFAHPLVEAMASGLPIVASDIAAHREIAGDAARYFPYFSPEKLAETLTAVLRSRDLRSEMSRRGLVRANAFSWRRHVDEMLAITQEMISDRHN